MLTKEKLENQLNSMVKFEEKLVNIFILNLIVIYYHCSVYLKKNNKN